MNVAPRVAASASTDRSRARQSTKFGHASDIRPPRGVSSDAKTSRSGSANGSGRSRTASTIEKMAVEAPMPSMSVASAAAVKPGACRSMRMP